MTNPAYEATNSDVEKLIADMKAAAEKATPLQLDTAQLKRGNDGYLECPCCDGAGEVEDLNDFCNIDGKALGVQFYGIGEHHGLAEEYFRQVTPANVLALIAAMEQAQRQNKLHERAEFTFMNALNLPDTAGRNEILAGILAVNYSLSSANRRITELESSPNGMMQLSNELADMKRNKFVVKLPCGTGWSSDPYNHGRNSGVKECADAIRAAGGEVSGE